MRFESQIGKLYELVTTLMCELDKPDMECHVNKKTNKFSNSIIY